MSYQLPSSQDAKRPPFLRRKRTIFLLAAGFFTVFFLRSFLFSKPTKVQFDELHGLLYMVSKTENVVPHDIDLASPVAPSIWVPREVFNSQLWTERVELLNQEIPIIVFSKSWCPYSRRAKDLLARYDLKPAPHIVEVDLRDDGDAIKSLLTRLTNRATFPNVILRGKSLGGYDTLQSLHETGDLAHELESIGVTVSGNIHGDDD